jgi:predicted permease
MMATGALQKGAVSHRELYRRLALSLVKHPILIGIVLGLLWRTSGQPMPRVLAAVVEPLASSAGPLALFASGMSLVNYGIGRQISAAAAISALKLVLLPVLTFFSAQAVGLPPVGVAALTLTAACPTGVNAYLIASRLGTGQALASNTVLISTAAGVATVSLWLALLQRMLEM